TVAALAAVTDIDEMLANAARTEEALVEIMTTSAEGRSPDHQIVVRLGLNEGITGLDADPYWLGTASADRVAASIQDACRAAQDQLDRAVREAFELLGPMRDLPALAGFLEQLTRLMGVASPAS
ncbi:hypothetical protein, partial [Plantactinospora mayteni]